MSPMCPLHLPHISQEREMLKLIAAKDALAGGAAAGDHGYGD